MKQKIILLLVAIFASVAMLASAADAQNEAIQSGEYVHSLTAENFQTFLDDNEWVLVEFYAPWCPHCKGLAPEYASAAEQIAKDEKLKNKIKLADINCEEAKELCSAQQVPGFPTMKLFKEGKFYKMFEEGRQAADIVNWLIRKCGPPSKEFENEAEGLDYAKQQMSNEVSAVLGRFNTKDSELFQNFEKVAAALEDFAFVSIISDDVKEESVTVMRYWSEENYSVDKNLDIDTMATNIKENGYPLVDEVSGKTFKRFADAKLPIAVLFVDYSNGDLKKQQIALLNKAAEALKGKISFGYSDGAEYGQQLEMMGGNAAKLPGLAAMDIEKRSNYPFPADKEITADSILEWATGVADGTISPFLRSQPVPENPVGEDGVTVVVGKSFDDIVLDAEKDVLVEFYAPWCGHCKKLAPVYSKVANYFADVKNLVIAKIDATENDVKSVAVQGFPTIFFFPSNQKANPITFSGERTAKGFKKFIAKNAVASKQGIVDLVKAKKAEKEEKRADL